MRFATVAVLLFVAALRAPAATPPPVQFSGVLVADGKTKVALTDTATGTTTWVETGKDFNGYTVASYDAKKDSIVLKKGGQEYPLALIESKTLPDATTSSAALVAAAPPPTPDGTLTPTGRPTQPQGATPVVVTNPQPASAPAPTVNVNVAPATPVPADPTYITRDGDTLTKISAATGLSMERLQELNPGVNPSALLKAGDPIKTR